MYDKIVDDAKFYARSLIKEGGHGWGHTKRVLSLCVDIGKKENADLFILSLAAIFHDTGRELEFKKSIPHEIASADIAKQYLEKKDISHQKISKIIHCIKAHRFSNDIEPKIPEAKILSESDKIDALGAVGIIRTIQHGIKYNRGIEGLFKHANEKLLKLKDLMYTKSAKKIAKVRHKFLEDFLDELKKEIS